MLPKLVPNQRAIRIKKALTDKEHLYTKINIQCMNKAMKELKPNTFKIWIYLSSNQDNYEFGLSRQDLIEKCNISEGTYKTAIKELIEKKYLVETELYENLKGYIFFEDNENVGQNLNHEWDKNYPTSELKIDPLVDKKLYHEWDKNCPRNIINNTNNITKDMTEDISSISEKLKLLGFSDEWINFALKSKKDKVWKQYGYGLLFKKDYQCEITEKLNQFKKKQIEKEKYFEKLREDLKKQLNQEPLHLFYAPKEKKEKKLIPLSFVEEELDKKGKL